VGEGNTSLRGSATRRKAACRTIRDFIFRALGDATAFVTSGLDADSEVDDLLISVNKPPEIRAGVPGANTVHRAQ
jgi:hypothetical protein